MAKNVLEQLRDFLVGGVKSVVKATPVGQAYNAYKQAQTNWNTPQVQQVVQPKIQQFTQNVSQGIKDLPTNLKWTAGQVTAPIQKAISSFQVPQFEMPKLQLPQMQMPQVQLPQFKMPQVEMPEAVTKFPERLGESLEMLGPAWSSGWASTRGGVAASIKNVFEVIEGLNQQHPTIFKIASVLPPVAMYNLDQNLVMQKTGKTISQNYMDIAKKNFDIVKAEQEKLRQYQMEDKPIGEKVVDPRFWVPGVASFVPNMIGAVGVGAAATILSGGNPLVGLGVGFSFTAALEGGTAYQQAIDEGATEEQADKVALIVGTINGTLEMLPFHEFLKNVAAGKMFRTGLNKVLVKTLLSEAAQQALAEGSTEALQEITSNAAAHYIYNEGQVIFNQAVIESGLLGAVSGLGFGAIGNVSPQPGLTIEDVSYLDPQQRIEEYQKMKEERVMKIGDAEEQSNIVLKNQLLQEIAEIDAVIYDLQQYQTKTKILDKATPEQVKTLVENFNALGFEAKILPKKRLMVNGMNYSLGEGLFRIQGEIAKFEKENAPAPVTQPVAPQAPAPPPVVPAPQTNLFGEEVVQKKKAFRPVQESLLGVTGEGQVAKEEIARTAEKISQKAPVTAEEALAGLPIAKPMERIQLKEQMGEGLFEQGNKQVEWIVDTVYNNEDSPEVMKQYLMKEGNISEEMANMAIEARDWVAKQHHVVTHQELADWLNNRTTTGLIADQMKVLETKNMTQKIEDYINDKSVKFREDPDILGLAIPLQREVTTKFFNIPVIQQMQTADYGLLKTTLQKGFLPQKGGKVELGLKGKEANVILKVLETEKFKDKPNIDMNELREAVTDELMPLDLIKLSHWAEYGAEEVGLGNGILKTYILNSPYEHGFTGHFSSDYGKVVPRENLQIKVIPVSEKNPTVKYAVVDTSVPLTRENIADNVYEVSSTKEKAQDWIDNNTVPAGEEAAAEEASKKVNVIRM